MMNFSTLILSSEVSGPGGLFDINATLPLVVIQFLILMFALNTLLFNPLLIIMEERKEYILTKLDMAAIVVNLANQILDEQTKELAITQKEAQLELINSQEIHKEILDLEIQLSQKYLDNLLDTVAIEFANQKTLTLHNLGSSVESLCDEINKQLSIPKIRLIPYQYHTKQ